MNSIPQRIELILAQFLSMQMLGYEYVNIKQDEHTDMVYIEPAEADQTGPRTSIVQIITLLTEILEDGVDTVVFTEEIDTQTNTYILKIHPVKNHIYETYRPEIDKAQLN